MITILYAFLGALLANAATAVAVAALVYYARVRRIKKMMERRG